MIHVCPFFPSSSSIFVLTKCSVRTGQILFELTSLINAHSLNKVWAALCHIFLTVVLIVLASWLVCTYSVHDCRLRYCHWVQSIHWSPVSRWHWGRPNLQVLQGIYQPLPRHVSGELYIVSFTFTPQSKSQVQSRWFSEYSASSVADLLYDLLTCHDIVYSWHMYMYKCICTQYTCRLTTWQSMPFAGTHSIRTSLLVVALTGLSKFGTTLESKSSACKAVSQGELP